MQYNFPQLLALWLEMGKHGGSSKRAVINAADRVRAAPRCLREFAPHSPAPATCPDVRRWTAQWDVTGLMLAAANGHGECALLLLRNGADVTARDCKGLTAEDWARRCGHGAVVKVLRDHGEQRHAGGATRA